MVAKSSSALFCASQLMKIEVDKGLIQRRFSGLSRVKLEDPKQTRFGIGKDGENVQM